MKYQFWSLIFRLELFLFGAYFFKSAIFDFKGTNWETGRILTLAAGISLLIIAVVISILKMINLLGTVNKLEMFSRYLAQLSLWCFLSLLVIEVTLRAVIYNPPLRRDSANWAGDIPGVHSVMLWGKEGYGITQYEKWGEIRTPYYDKEKNNDVIVLGDSQTECLQVNDSVKFTSVAETIVRQDGYDLDLHNLGRSGLAMADYVSWIPPFISLYRPKVIVVQLTENDFIESFQLGQFNNFVFRDNGEIDLIQTYDISSGFKQKVRRKYYFDSQIKELGYQRWYLMGGATGNLLAEIFNPMAKAKPLVENAAPESIGSTPAENVSTEIFTTQLAEPQMKMLLDVSEGIPLVVVLLPTAPFISGDKIQMVDPTHERLKEFIEHYPEITIVDPLPEFQQLASSGRLPRGFFNSTPGRGHLNKYGNEIVGRLLAKAVEQVLE